MTEGKKRVLGYTAYGLVALLVFAFLLFPSDAVREILESGASRTYPGVEVHMGSVLPSPLFGLKMNDIIVDFKGERCLKAAYVRVAPSFSSLLGRGLSFSFGAGVFGGKINGEFHMKGKSGSWKTGADLSGIRLDAMPFLKSIDYFSDIKGKVDGRVDAWDNGGEVELSTSAVFSDVALTLSRPAFSLDSATFERVETVVSVKPGLVSIKKCVASGGQLDGELSGSIAVMQPYGRSRLNIKGFVKPKADLVAALGRSLPVDILLGKDAGEKGFPVYLGGTLGNPSFSIR
ncbi:MAG: type II secretion system protein GspN [Desulfococcus sp. 4484_241]|nr:MAG: type II secretion system protein GspN [Desulfococcus sp. 4484_241]